MKSELRLVRLVLNDELATRPVEHAEHRHFGALARRRNAQIGPFLGPDVRQIGMGERFGLVAEQKHDVARLGLSLEQLSAQARPVHGVRILAAFQRVAGSPPAKAPFFRSTTESREREMRTPARVSISSARRGSVQFGRSATGTGQDLLGHDQRALGFDGSWPRRDRCLQGFDPARHEGAAPEAHRILAHPEGLGDLAAGPARQGEQDRPRPVRLAAIPRMAQSQQPLPLLFVRRNR